MPAPKGHPPYPGCEKGGVKKVYTKEYIDAEADAFLEWMSRPTSIYYKRFCFERGYSHQRLSEFAECNEKFAETYKKAKEWQEMKLAEGGLTNEFNAGFTKFVMGNICGWTEKTESKISGDALNPFVVFMNNLSGESKDLVTDDSTE
jgi:DNA-packaging protein gp3